ncbi:MAG: glycosyltransferase family 9 protein [Pseudomonadota bacterium]
MKILVAQLARLGDIYLTWPILNGLIRQNPDAEIHFLVRERYASACVGLNPAIKIHQLDTAHILEPAITDAFEEQSLRRLDKFVQPLLAEKFDKVINLSFSPFSSFFIHAFEREGAQIAGYTRHSDGFFQVADDGSAYFYAQVGTHSFNRYHLLDVFALIAGIRLQSSDMCGPDVGPSPDVDAEAYICLHVGASQSEKAIPPNVIADIVRKICGEEKLHLVLIGSSEERDAIDRALQGEDFEGHLLNFVGKTTVEQATALVSKAYLIIGADSFAMHVGTLSSTPCINLSCDFVNYWETGPLSQSSRIIYENVMEDHSVDSVWRALAEIIEFSAESEFIQCQSERLGEPRFFGSKSAEGEFQWNLISALYSGGSFPVLDDFSVYKNLVALANISTVALEALSEIHDPDKRRSASELLGQIDTAIEGLGKNDPNLFPVVRWFQTEKVRIGPLDFDELLSRTQVLYESLLKVSRIYVANEDIESNKEVRP